MVLSQEVLLQLQSLLNLATIYANEEHYVIHPQKTVIVPFNMHSKQQRDHTISDPPWHINSAQVPADREVVHLGIRRDMDNPYATIEDRVKCARRTLYAMHGPGLHGMSGLPVKTCIKLYNSYVLPRALYGLEAISLNDTARKMLETFHRHALRCILGLPERTAIPALYILTGQLPITYQNDIKVLNFLLGLLSSDPTREVILRQYTVKKDNTKSLVKNFSQKLHNYGLPTIYDLYMCPPTKPQWKRQVRMAVQKIAVRELAQDAESMSSLRFLSKVLIPGVVHPTLGLTLNSRQVTRACIKARLATNTYPLQHTNTR